MIFLPSRLILWTIILHTWWARIESKKWVGHGSRQRFRVGALNQIRVLVWVHFSRWACLRRKLWWWWPSRLKENWKENIFLTSDKPSFNFSVYYPGNIFTVLWRIFTTQEDIQYCGGYSLYCGRIPSVHQGLFRTVVEYLQLRENTISNMDIRNKASCSFS